MRARLFHPPSIVTSSHLTNYRARAPPPLPYPLQTNGNKSKALFVTFIDCPVGCAYANAGVQASDLHFYLWSGVLKIDSLRGTGELNVSGAQLHVPARTPVSLLITPNRRPFTYNRFWMEGGNFFIAGTQAFVVSPTAPFQLVPQEDEVSPSPAPSPWNMNGLWDPSNPSKETFKVTLKDPVNQSNMRSSNKENGGRVATAEAFTIRVTTSFIERAPTPTKISYF